MVYQVPMPETPARASQRTQEFDADTTIEGLAKTVFRLMNGSDKRKAWQFKNEDPLIHCSILEKEPAVEIAHYLKRS
jgi:hypothetical protein